MFELINRIEKLFYKLRDFLWDYPGFLVLNPDSLYNYVLTGYSVTRPYSHIIVSIAVVLASIYIAFNPLILHAEVDNKTLIEGVAMGVNEDGTIQTLDTVTPLIPSRFQFGADLLELIYEPLIKVSPDGGIVYKLASKVEPVKDKDGNKLSGVDYLFTLRDDVYWHDGTKFTTADVVATFNKIVELADAELGSNRAQALKQMGIVAIDDYSFRLFVEQEDPTITKLFPNFLELVSFKVMPAKYLAEINPLTVSTYEPIINRKPIGTGKYQFIKSTENEIILERFNSYYGTKPKINSLVFRLFKTEDALASAIKNGEIHSFALGTSRYIRDIERFPNLAIHNSAVIYNQYWALYFNLVNGPEHLKDPLVRKALGYAVNYNLMLESILNNGEVAKGPIPTNSPYFNKNAEWPDYNLAKAKDLLSNSGWALNPSGIWEKEGQQLELSIKFADQYDRSQVIESIQKDWEELGAKVEIEAVSLAKLRDEYLLPRSFDTLVYGMSTFIDPDRFELFHSSAIEYPGLNISGYTSSETTKKIVNRKLVDVSKTDRSLEIGQSTLDSKLRTEEYNEFQRLLAKDQPAIFLYHPRFIYVTVKDLKGINLSSINSLEQRFDQIEEWFLE